ncbi:acetoacetyl-CoA synthetase [Caerostris extrusa]|uniref:Acetoacetyl-CoA synthetase n=1 Tax=Caerostris extrusa TaxID=172846 RepID=A0AAV4XD32_CAEEX|nr:acetoacetyl-CoA synthetase [Caerostris extrusa]
MFRFPMEEVRQMCEIKRYFTKRKVAYIYIASDKKWLRRHIGKQSHSSSGTRKCPTLNSKNSRILLKRNMANTLVLVKTGSGFLDNEWFSGARLNFAENLMRIRDNRIALMCLDELGNEDSVTFAEMFEEVRLYAAAFRKQGLTVGDRVACIMTNRKEAMFAMLATTSIGAIWSGPPTISRSSQSILTTQYYPAKTSAILQAISNLVKFVDPKIIFALDHFQDEGEEIDNFDKLVEAAKGEEQNLKSFK